MMEYTDKVMEKLFTYHPSHDKVPFFEYITDGTKKLAYIIRDNTPDSPDKDMAMHYLRMARMCANSAIACFSEGKGNAK